MKDGGKDVWIKHQVGIDVAFILGALPFFFFLMGSANCPPVCLALKNHVCGKQSIILVEKCFC